MLSTFINTNILAKILLFYLIFEIWNDHIHTEINFKIVFIVQLHNAPISQYKISHFLN